MLQDGSRYVIYSADTLYYLPNSSCSEGSSVTLNNTNVVRYRLINGHWLASDNYTTGQYANTTYYCHVYSDDVNLNYRPDSFILPATIIVICFFSIVFHWFLRLRG